MNVTVDADQCMGHGQCYAYGPDVYAPDDQGFCAVLTPQVEGNALEQAVAGAEACPESAITISEETDV